MCFHWSSEADKAFERLKKLFEFTITYHSGPRNCKSAALSLQFSSDHGPSTPVAILPEEWVVGLLNWEVEMEVRGPVAPSRPRNGPRNRLLSQTLFTPRCCSGDTPSLPVTLAPLLPPGSLIISLGQILDKLSSSYIGKILTDRVGHLAHVEGGVLLGVIPSVSLSPSPSISCLCFSCLFTSGSLPLCDLHIWNSSPANRPHVPPALKAWSTFQS